MKTTLISYWTGPLELGHADWSVRVNSIELKGSAVGANPRVEKSTGLEAVMAYQASSSAPAGFPYHVLSVLHTPELLSVNVGVFVTFAAVGCTR